MSSGTVSAAATFASLLRDPENLVALHRAQRMGRVGRPGEEVSTNRAVVVLAVAAWQTFVEDTATAILESQRPPIGTPLADSFRLLTSELERLTDRLNTPDSKKTIELFGRLGFDPSPAWTFTIRWPLQVGKVSGPRAFVAKSAANELDAWLEVRHLIAHGKPLAAGKLVPTVTTGRPKNGPSLLRRDAEHCLSFFRALVKATADAADAQFA